MKRSIDAHGYVVIWMPKHPLASKNGRVKEHRMVWFDAHGSIPVGHEIHHINGDKTDNRLENLECVDGTAHRRKHAKQLNQNYLKHLEETGRPAHGTREFTCKHCRQSFTRTTAYVNRHIGRNKMTFEYCGRKCVALATQKRIREAGAL